MGMWIKVIHVPFVLYIAYFHVLVTPYIAACEGFSFHGKTNGGADSVRRLAATDYDYRENGGARLMAVDCYSGAELAAAFASRVAQILRIRSDIILTEWDWESIAVPVLMQRNVTVMGASAEPTDYPVLDLGFVRGKISLGLDVKLTFTRVVLRNYRKIPFFQAPALDIVYSVEGGEASYGTLNYDPGLGISTPSLTILVSFEQAALIHKWCIPENETYTAVRTAPRPYGDNGTQQAVPRIRPLPGADICTNDPTRWDLRRCWPAVGMYVDIATYCYNTNNASGTAYRFWLAGYIMHAKDTYYLCEREMGDDCVQKYSTVGCFASSMQQNETTAVTGGGGGGGGGSSEDGDRMLLLGIVLPSVIGGCLLVSAAVSLAVWASRKRRRSCSCSSGGESAGTGGVPACASAVEVETMEDGGARVAGGGSGGGQSIDSMAAKSSGDSEFACESEAPGRSEDRKAVFGAGTKQSDDITDQPQSGGNGSLIASTPANSGRMPGSSAEPLRCNRDEVALAPITPMTPLLPVINLAAKLRAASHKQGCFPPAPTTTASTASAAGAADAAATKATSVADEVRLLPNQALGSGAYGKVVAGLYHGERVAVKLINTGLTDDMSANPACTVVPAVAVNGLPQRELAAATRALAQEVEVLARCQHPNIVRLLAACLEPSHMCLVMELMDTSLEGLMYGGRGRALPLPVVLHIAIQIARALSYMHPTILHRDLKPANVLISQSDSDKPIAKLADFGMARLLNTVLVTRNPEVGTAPYMAPETFDVQNAGTITDRADIYSLGVILWEMVTREQPWKGMSIFQIAALVTIAKRRLSMDRMTPGCCPLKLRSVILSCWDPDPARRPAAAEVVKSLALVQEMYERP